MLVGTTRQSYARGTPRDADRCADEANYFNRQDREAVKKLLAKLHSEEQANQDPLETLFAHHATNLSPALKEDILKWASKK